MVVMSVQPWSPLLPSWISPGAAWFIFFNAVVAAIAAMSSCAQQEPESASPRRRLCRSASSTVLDQLSSLSLFSVHPTTASDDLAGVSDPDSEYYHSSPEAEVLPLPPPQVAEVSMVVTAAETPRSMAPVTGECVAPSAPALTASAADESTSAPASKDGDADAEEEQDESMSMDEAYAMVRQLCRPPQSQLATTTVVSWPQKKKELAAMGPRRRRRREAEEAAPEGKAELNARAELFIRQFREELKLQRLNSLLRHTHAFGTLDGAPAAMR